MLSFGEGIIPLSCIHWRVSWGIFEISMPIRCKDELQREKWKAIVLDNSAFSQTGYPPPQQEVKSISLFFLVS